jgi:hypothetical protein
MPRQEAGQRAEQEAPGNDGLLGISATLTRPECVGAILPSAAIRLVEWLKVKALSSSPRTAKNLNIFIFLNIIFTVW